MTAWSDLTRELDAWAANGQTARLWWRDDDAVAVTPALERLITLHRTTGVPLALAVIPGLVQAELAERLAHEPGIAVVQHGWAHLNHARPGRPKAELGPDRPPSFVLGELVRGQARLDQLFGNRWLRVLVPPHNRIAPAVAGGLGQAGYVGLSADKPRRTPPPGIVQINTHIDIMEWTVTRAFLGDGPCLDQAVTHLAAKRAGQADRGEPTGFLTHHLAHDEPAWRFMEQFTAATRAHPAVEWCDPVALFRPKIAAAT